MCSQIKFVLFLNDGLSFLRFLVQVQSPAFLFFFPHKASNYFPNFIILIQISKLVYLWFDHTDIKMSVVKCSILNSYNTSPASHFVPLQASPVGLLSRFAHLTLRVLRSYSRSLRSLRLCSSRSHFQSLRSLAFRAFAIMKIFKKRSVSQST